MKRWRRKWVLAVKVLLAAFTAVLFLTPTLLTITNSFMSSTEIAANYGSILDRVSEIKKEGKTYVSEQVNLKFIPDRVTFSQYITVLLKSPDYLFKFWNAVILVVPIVVVQLLLAAGAAYGFVRFSGRAKQLLLFVYTIIMLMPYQVTLVPNFLVSQWLHLLNTRWAIWLPGFFSPFSVFILTKAMKRIPLSVIEAAKMDGAGEWAVFSKICLPMCKSTLFSVAILVFIDYWNMVEQPLILLADTDLHPLSVFLSKINTGEVGLAFAVATIYMIPSLLLFLYGEEYLVEGITYSGSVKG